MQNVATTIGFLARSRSMENVDVANDAIQPKGGNSISHILGRNKRWGRGKPTPSLRPFRTPRLE